LVPVRAFSGQILPKGQYFDAQCFNSIILFVIAENRSMQPGKIKAKNGAHFDSASPHTARSAIRYTHGHRLVRAPHPLFSPELAPSDFYLFGKVKTALMGATFEDEDQLFQGVMHVLHRTPRDELEAVFDERLVRLDACIQRAGDYVE
jgi:hypothetical protein